MLQTATGVRRKGIILVGPISRQNEAKISNLNSPSLLDPSISWLSGSFLEAICRHGHGFIILPLLAHCIRKAVRKGLEV